MKTIRLTSAESAAYTNGERRFWRAMRKQPDRTMVAVFVPHPKPEPYWNVGGFRLRSAALHPYPCPYGKPGDYIKLAYRGHESKEGKIAKVEVDKRNGRWGWVVEVGV